MKKILFTLLLIGVCLPVSILAQTQNTANNGPLKVRGMCGSTFEDNEIAKTRMLHNKKLMKNSAHTRTGVITWIPVRFHITATSTGSNRIDEMKVFEMLCGVNEDFLPLDIQFYVKDSEFKYINNNFANSDPRGVSSSGGPLQMQLSRNNENDVIHIYTVDFITAQGGNQGQVLAYWDPGFDWLVLRNDQISLENAETMSHELGHYFSLPHPFHGWDGEYWDEAIHGNPVNNINSPGGVLNELADGSNCTQAGDGICDTRANYGLGFGWDGCNYTGGVKDPQGDLLDPQEENFMAYFLGCGSEFTPEQTARILDDLANRPQLETDYVPNTNEVMGIANLVSPINEEVTPLFNVVQVDWDPVPGADYYFVEASRSTTFTQDPKWKFVKNGTSVEFEDLTANKKYYWRVLALSEGHNNCDPQWSQNQTFRTGTTTSVQDITSVKEWSIHPNPVTNDQQLNINLVTDISFDSKVVVYSISGQELKVIDHRFKAGESSLNLPIHDWSTGMYLVSIQTEEGVLNEKIVVTR